MKCIDANKLIMKDLGNGNYIVTAEAIANARTFEAEPVKHGHWVMGSVLNEHGVLQYMNYVCSACKIGSDYKTDYCPHCGAKMREEE